MEPNAEKNVKKAPYKNWALAVFVALLVILFVLGRELFSRFTAENIYVFIIVTVLVGYGFNAIVYELGRLIMGKICGYRLVSLNLFGITIRRKDGKLKLGIESFENLGGKTVMAPKNDKAKPIPYLLGGGILYLIVSSILFTIAMVYKNMEDFSWGIVVVIAIGMVLNVYYLLPLRMDVYTDGFLIRILLSQKGAKKAFHDNLLQEEALYEDIEKLQLYEYDDYYNTFEAQSLIYRLYYFVHREQYDNAKEVADQIIEVESYLLDNSIIEAYAIKLFFLFLSKSGEEVGTYYWDLKKSIRNSLASSNNLTTLKSALGIAGLIDSNYDEYEYILHRYEKLQKKYQFQARKDDEVKMIETLIEKIKMVNPNW